MQGRDVIARIFHSRWVARATCPCRRATSPAEARRQTCRVASLRHDKVLVHAWSASCRPEQAGSLFHPSGGKQYEIFGLARSLRERMERGLQSAGRLGSEGTLKAQENVIPKNNSQACKAETPAMHPEQISHRRLCKA